MSNNQGGHIRSSYVFRGMLDSNWDLKTSLQRLGSEIEKIEYPSIRNFRKFARMGTFKNDSFWEVLSVAQHNGLPTRCLDWSNSPLIAAHFATDDPTHKDKDGVIWCVNTTKWKNNCLNKDLKKELEKAMSWVFDLTTLDRIFPQLNSLNSFKPTKTNSDLEPSFDNVELLFFEPPSIDQRIQNQYGILSVSTNPEMNIKNYLKFYSKMFPGLVYRIIIKAECKNEVRDMLDQNNINERMLYPGLPGLCQWLKRYYGKL